MEEHLGYAKHASSGKDSGNSRNGYTKKRLKGDHGDIELTVPRDRQSSFNPVIVKKDQSRITQFDNQVPSLFFTYK